MNHSEHKQPANPSEIADELVFAAVYSDDEGREFVERVGEALLANQVAVLGRVAARLEFINDHDPSTIDETDGGKFLRIADMRDAILTGIPLLSPNDQVSYRGEVQAERERLADDLAEITDSGEDIND